MKSSVNIMGIKCDNENCDYVDFTVPYEDYPNWINKPCPKCGDNLLTQEAYNQVKIIMDIYNDIKDVEFDESELCRVMFESGKDGIINVDIEEMCK